jgi:hypothetical protein
MINFAIAPVGLGAHGLELPAAAECGLKAVASRLLSNQWNPSVCIRKEDDVGVVDLDELKEIGEDYLLRPLEPLLALVEDLDTGDIPRKFGSLATSIPMMLRGTWKSGENLDSSRSRRSFSARY